jgi:L-malate glycosyltransferase
MKVLVVSHTYVASINREKWQVLAALNPDLTLMVVFPRLWPTHLFVHHANIGVDEQQKNCTFLALDTIKEGNELSYVYSHKQLFTVIKTFRPDLIHVEQGSSALSYFQINCYAKMLNIKIKSVFFTWVNWRPHTSFKHRLIFSPIEKINLM